MKTLDFGPSSTILGYCTNVHAGGTYARTVENLERYAASVRTRVCPDGAMGVGLWLAAEAARELVREGRAAEFRDWLVERGLRAYTLNGFPHGDFHQPVVKHRVYHPTWAERARLDYTLDLVAILHGLLPAGEEGSISTLPLGWRSDFTDAGMVKRAAGHLVELSEHLAKLEAKTGRLIHVALEPEPGCYLDTSADVVKLFRDHLLPAGDEGKVLRHLRVCHDVCHAAVMFEDQRAMFERYAAAGIGIGKVQLSSAVRLDGVAMDAAAYVEALAQMRAFAEDRYLHQAMVRAENGETRFFEDLPAALSDDRAARQRSEWRVHFHVPLFVERFGALGTMQGEVVDCLSLLRTRGDVKHYEVETYAWGVLPAELREDDLAAGIAREMRWVLAVRG